MDKITLPEGTKIPDHIALILDGNRRWARARGLHTLQGHKAGFKAGMKIARAARDWGVHTFTVWGFSTENWDRSKEEIDYLMTLYWKMVEEVRKEARKEGIRFVHLGRKDRFPKKLMAFIAQVEKETRHNTNYIFNAALDYGGHDEIIRTVQKIITAKIPAEKVDDKLFASYLDTGDQPYPYVDLFIRTSGEQRTSGLLPWQMHYAEYYWEMEHLPDFTPEKLRNAVLDYSRRRRRFGGNDAESHLRFDPKVLANIEIKWRRELNLAPGERIRDLAVSYLKEATGLSKDLAKEAGTHFAKALLYRRDKEWALAKGSLQKLCAIIKKTLNLAFEPEVVANIQVNLWKNEHYENVGLEEIFKLLYAEAFRLSDFQLVKAAKLKTLAKIEMTRQNWDQAKTHLERFYQALKERVA